MCGAIGFEAEVVSGYIRKREQAGISIKEPNHDWNVVKVSGKWELIDVTWASTSKERFYIDYFYFLTPAQEFITNHFPEDKKWQLLEKPILKEEFDAYPFMSSSYFKYGLDLDFPKTGYIKNTSGKFTLRVKKPDAGDWKVTVYNINTGEWNDIYYSYDKELGQLEIVLKRKGIYLISLDVIESTFFDFYHSNTNILCFNIEYY
jgi:transglutaminase/protease-like cytokinesis protein 3